MRISLYLFWQSLSGIVLDARSNSRTCSWVALIGLLFPLFRVYTRLSRDRGGRLSIFLVSSAGVHWIWVCAMGLKTRPAGHFGRPLQEIVRKNKQTNQKEVDAPDVSLSNLKSFALFFRASFVLIMAGLAVFLALVHNVIPRWNNELCVTQILICLTTRLFFFSLKLRSKNGLLCCESDCSCPRTRYRTLPYMDIWFWQHVQFFSQIA